MRQELINFLREERKKGSISFYCNDFEFADRLLKLINSDLGESKAVVQNEEQSEICDLCNGTGIIYTEWFGRLAPAACKCRHKSD